jgi:hypothetical protein
MTASVRRVGLAELAVRLQAFAETASYVVLLASADAIPELVTELPHEIEALDEHAVVRSIAAETSAGKLIAELRSSTQGTVVINASRYDGQDWRFLDRRRSALARRGATVFVTTPGSFDELMRVAPNVASWLGALAFAWDDTAGELTEEQKMRRLEALRAWSGKSDAEVLQAAEEGHLPRDPEFAEWLVLMGRGDLLDVS